MKLVAATVTFAVPVLPFTIPALVFGVSADAAVVTGPMPVLPPFLILAALTLVSAVVAPIAGAAAIRAGLE
ncbi:MAG: heme exporter protein CcmB [Candidatus Eisenbacteria bacterium]